MSIRETHTATITLNVQQMFELSKAIADRVAKYIRATDDGYPYRHQDIETLLSVHKMIDPHIVLVTETYEDEIATKESAILDNEEEVKKFMEDDK